MDLAVNSVPATALYMNLSSTIEIGKIICESAHVVEVLSFDCVKVIFSAPDPQYFYHFWLCDFVREEDGCVQQYPPIILEKWAMLEEVLAMCK